MSARLRDGARLALRVGVVLCLLLAALVLGADSGEYPAPSRPGIRALLRGALPLFGVGALHLLLLDPPAGLRVEHRRALTLLAFAVDVLVGLVAARLMRRNGGPVFAMILVVAIVLGAGVWSTLRDSRA